MQCKFKPRAEIKFLVHFWSKEDEFHCKLMGNIEPVKPEKSEPQRPSLKISHFTKPDKVRARISGKTVSPSPKISGPDPTLLSTFNFKHVKMNSIIMLCFLYLGQIPFFFTVFITMAN